MMGAWEPIKLQQEFYTNDSWKGSVRLFREVLTSWTEMYVKYICVIKLGGRKQCGLGCKHKLLELAWLQ